MSASTVPSSPARDSRIAELLSGRRRRMGKLVDALCIVATLFGLFLLASILGILLWNGLGGLNLDVFTQMTQPTGYRGGLLNAIVGTLIQSGLGTAIGTPIGLLVGTYLSEYGRHSQLGNVVRFVSDILLSAPSILIGLFIYLVVVAPGGGYSGWAGVAALAMIVIPIVVRTTEDMLRLIPVSLREAAVALGAPKYKAIVSICYRAALEGIATGVLLAIARVAGETAPLLFTSFGNQNWSLDLTQPLASLPITIYNYTTSPFHDWIQLGWVGALLITFGVLALNIIARVVLRKRG